jgi:hypothetical protein
MTEQPYTDDDLRAEAARQHALSLEDPDFMGIGERMDCTPIPSRVVDLEPETGEPLEMSRAWSHLPREDFDAAQRNIDNLLTSAADVSDWAVNLGADGLAPHAETIDIPTEGGEIGVRILFAFHPQITPALRKVIIDAVRDDARGNQA